MARLKVTAYIDVDESLVDRHDPCGLTELGYNKMNRMLSGFDDVETSLVEDD